MIDSAPIRFEQTPLHMISDPMTLGRVMGRTLKFVEEESGYNTEMLGVGSAINRPTEDSENIALAAQLVLLHSNTPTSAAVFRVQTGYTTIMERTIDTFFDRFHSTESEGTRIQISQDYDRGLAVETGRNLDFARGVLPNGDKSYTVDNDGNARLSVNKYPETRKLVPALYVPGFQDSRYLMELRTTLPRELLAIPIGEDETNGLTNMLVVGQDLRRSANPDGVSGMIVQSRNPLPISSGDGPRIPGRRRKAHLSGEIERRGAVPAELEYDQSPVEYVFEAFSAYGISGGATKIEDLKTPDSTSKSLLKHLDAASPYERAVRQNDEENHSLEQTKQENHRKLLAQLGHGKVIKRRPLSA